MKLLLAAAAVAIPTFCMPPELQRSLEVDLPEHERFDESAGNAERPLDES